MTQLPVLVVGGGIGGLGAPDAKPPFEGVAWLYDGIRVPTEPREDDR